jgi:hypothetical protein
MTNFQCTVCDKVFTRKTNLNYHENNNVCRPKPIIDENEENNEEEENNDKVYKCSFCSKIFNSATNMYRHMKYSCKIKKKEDNDRDKIYAMLLESNKRFAVLEESNKRLEEEVAKMKNTKGTRNTNNTANINNGTININNNNIILVGYGNEDLSRINRTDILRAVQDGYGSVVSLSKTVHFNPKYPEYQNIYISNMKDIYAMMFDGDKWTLTTKADLVEKIYQDKKDYIEENLEEFVASLLPSRKRALERWLDTDEEDDKIRKIKNDIKILLYNEKQLGIDSRELYESKIKAIKLVTGSDSVKPNRSQKVKPSSIKNKMNDSNDDSSENDSAKNKKIIKLSKPLVTTIKKPVVKVRKAVQK